MDKVSVKDCSRLAIRIGAQSCRWTWWVIERVHCVATTNHVRVSVLPCTMQRSLFGNLGSSRELMSHRGSRHRLCLFQMSFFKITDKLGAGDLQITCAPGFWVLFSECPWINPQVCREFTRATASDPRGYAPATLTHSNQLNSFPMWTYNYHRAVVRLWWPIALAEWGAPLRMCSLWKRSNIVVPANMLTRYWSEFIFFIK